MSLAERIGKEMRKYSSLIMINNHENKNQTEKPFYSSFLINKTEKNTKCENKIESNNRSIG